MALVYIDRVQGRDFVVNSLNVHRLLVTRFGPCLLEHAWRAPRRARHTLPPSRASAVTFEAAMAASLTVAASPRSVMLAAKFFDDTYCNNEYWARIAGVSNAEMNRFAPHAVPHARVWRPPCLWSCGGNLSGPARGDRADFCALCVQPRSGAFVPHRVPSVRHARGL